MYKLKHAHSGGEIERIIHLRYRVLREPWSQPMATATDALEDKSVNAYIENEHKEIIACARLQENEGKIGQIRFMAVDDDYQGKGLGKMLVNFLENKGKELKLQKIELQARENAVEFYKTCGYSVKEKTFLLWGMIQHFLMEKQL
jgi:N-acetylglutamate synthase-like GNAT family acetyltransferase